MLEIIQYKFSEVKAMSFDAVIVSSGFESRASYQAKHLDFLSADKIALCFDSETDDETRKINDSYFIESGFEMITVTSDINCQDLLEGIFNKISKKNSSKDLLNIYIDYSSMVRTWYAAIIHIINRSNYSQTINLYFGYSYAKYISSANTDVLNKIVEPLFGYCNLSVPSKPTALIICLGNEKNRVYGLQEYFDAATYLFYSDSNFDNEYSDEVEKVNIEILSSTRSDNIIRFPVHDLIYTDYLIENLCKVLIKDFRVVIAPCGPKPFILLALINSIKFKYEKNNLICIYLYQPVFTKLQLGLVVWYWWQKR